MESFKYGSFNQKEYGMDEMLTPTDIQKHLKIGRNKTYQLIQLSSFPKIKIGNTYRIPPLSIPRLDEKSLAHSSC